MSRHSTPERSESHTEREEEEEEKKREVCEI